jgi:hypothetical protein
LLLIFQTYNHSDMRGKIVGIRWRTICFLKPTDLRIYST